MADNDAAIKGLEEIAEYMEARADVAGIGKVSDLFNGWYRATVDAIGLLKAQDQEPVTMKPYYFNYVCSGCRSEIDGEFIEYTGGKIKFCPWCGRKVRWRD